MKECGSLGASRHLLDFLGGNSPQKEETDFPAFSVRSTLHAVLVDERASQQLYTRKSCVFLTAWFHRTQKKNEYLPIS